MEKASPRKSILKNVDAQVEFWHRDRIGKGLQGARTLLVKSCHLRMEIVFLMCQIRFSISWVWCSGNKCPLLIGQMCLLWRYTVPLIRFWKTCISFPDLYVSDGTKDFTLLALSQWHGPSIMSILVPNVKRCVMDMEVVSMEPSVYVILAIQVQPVK